MADLPFFDTLSGGGSGGGTTVYEGITALEINDEGHLIATYDDGKTSDLGNVIGKDGKVYVAHIDEHKILTYTIEDEAQGVPDPVDLNPNDEWSDMEQGSGEATDYVWEDMPGYTGA